jgi:hypothetical protein
MQAHICRGVVMDIAAFKVSHSISHSIGIDIDADATALRAARARSSSIGAVEERSIGKGRRRAHIIRSVRIHVGVGQVCRATDAEPPTLPAARTT